MDHMQLAAVLVGITAIASSLLILAVIVGGWLIDRRRAAKRREKAEYSFIEAQLGLDLPDDLWGRR
jgi:hypothetical protein